MLCHVVSHDNKCNNSGVSPIYIAADALNIARQKQQCLKLLLGAGADPRSIFKGASALDIARQKSHTECVRVLEVALA